MPRILVRDRLGGWRRHSVGSKFFRIPSGEGRGQLRGRRGKPAAWKVATHPVWRLSVRRKSSLPRGWMLSPRFARPHHRSRAGRGAPTPSVKNLEVLKLSRFDLDNISGEVVSQLFASSMKPMRSRRAFYVQLRSTREGDW